jgi:peptidoglycan/LPS O-acetylase OafA/YrhL
MATLNLSFDRSPRRTAAGAVGPYAARLSWPPREKGHVPAVTASPLGILAYILVLASVAVIVLTGQFPWFTLAPLTALALTLYFRHLEESLRRDAPPGTRPSTPHPGPSR